MKQLFFRLCILGTFLFFVVACSGQDEKTEQHSETGTESHDSTMMTKEAIKDSATDKIESGKYMVEEKVTDMKEHAAETATDLKEQAVETATEIKEHVVEKTHDVVEGAKDAAGNLQMPPHDDTSMMKEKMKMPEVPSFK